MKPAAIAAELGVTPALIRKWKNYYKWEEQPDPKPRGRGAPKGNKNAAGNNGGAPPGNDNAVKHGLFRKFMPDDEETLEIFDATAEFPQLEMLWTSIRIAWTNIVRAQKIMFVLDRDDMTKEVKKRESMAMGDMDVEKEEWEIQFAWDKQAAALNAQTAAMARLSSMIKQYEEMLRSLPAEEVQEEQRQRVNLLRAQVDKAQAEANVLKKNTNKEPLRIEIDYGDGEP